MLKSGMAEVRSDWSSETQPWRRRLDGAASVRIREAPTVVLKGEAPVVEQRRSTAGSGIGHFTGKGGRCRSRVDRVSVLEDGWQLTSAPARNLRMLGRLLLLLAGRVWQSRWPERLLLGDRVGQRRPRQVLERNLRCSLGMSLRRGSKGNACRDVDERLRDER